VKRQVLLAAMVSFGCADRRLGSDDSATGSTGNSEQDTSASAYSTLSVLDPGDAMA
jgi:hypothetical protein